MSQLTRQSLNLTLAEVNDIPAEYAWTKPVMREFIRRNLTAIQDDLELMAQMATTVKDVLDSSPDDILSQMPPEVVDEVIEKVINFTESLPTGRFVERKGRWHGIVTEQKTQQDWAALFGQDMAAAEIHSLFAPYMRKTAPTPTGQQPFQTPAPSWQQHMQQPMATAGPNRPFPNAQINFGNPYYQANQHQYHPQPQGWGYR